MALSLGASSAGFTGLILAGEKAKQADDETRPLANFASILSARLAEEVRSRDTLSIEPGEGVEGNAALRATYIGSDRGSERIVFSVPLEEPGPEYTLNFNVRFCPGFQFVKGGKLHGFGSAEAATGGMEVEPDSWSARLMFEPEGKLRTYVYHQRQKRKWGDSERSKGFQFKPGVYHALSLQIQLNSPASKPNGSLTVYADGKEIIKHKRIQFRSVDTADSLVSTLLFSTFHGGGSPDWAPRHADGTYSRECAHFDNMTVHPGLRAR